MNKQKKRIPHRQPCTRTAALEAAWDCAGLCGFRSGNGQYLDVSVPCRAIRRRRVSGAYILFIVLFGPGRAVG